MLSIFQVHPIKSNFFQKSKTLTNRFCHEICFPQINFDNEYPGCGDPWRTD